LTPVPDSDLDTARYTDTGPDTDTALDLDMVLWARDMGLDSVPALDPDTGMVPAPDLVLARDTDMVPAPGLALDMALELAPVWDPGGTE